MNEAKGHRSECRRPASLRIIAFECGPASIVILRAQERLNRFPTPVFSIALQRHHRVASCFDSNDTTVPACPTATGKGSSFDLRLKFIQKPHKENESFQTENLSIDTHT